MIKKLLVTLRVALAAYDEANRTGKGSWTGEQVERMRVAVIRAENRKG